MACACGSTMRTGAPVKNIHTIDMKQFLLDKGWTLVGQCNCTPRFDIFTNGNYPKYSVYLNGNMYKIKYQIVPGNNQTQAMGPLNTFEQKYNDVFK